MSSYRPAASALCDEGKKVGIDNFTVRGAAFHPTTSAMPECCRQSFHGARLPMLARLSSLILKNSR
jgi:hypothetical protein